ncbi:MAG: GNAT family N-acetyltransferase [Alphaproteobacteria bacterium]|nr:GNAT family N-acetyltransferase [Alphaproteobacteria bacterium]
MSTAPILLLTDTPSEAAQAVIDAGLADYNEEQAGYRDARDLAVLVADPVDGRVLGGLLGRTSLGLMFVDLVYLPSDLQRAGVGRRILRMAEEEALRRGCISAVLFTISFQAPEFYVLHGWREIGRVPCLPAGTSRVVMMKQLA